MELFYDDRDVASGLPHVRWLRDEGARPVSRAGADSVGILFAGARSLDDYTRLVAGRPSLVDRPLDRAPLLRLDSVLDALAAARVSVPTPRTWRLELDAPIPEDIRFPLFVRTAATSWKLGGHISRVRNRRELEAEAAELRRAIQWDATILGREWLDLAAAGDGTYGSIPQEVRVWVVDGRPFAWSFHHLHVCRNPKGFPLSGTDVRELRGLAEQVASAFASVLVVADFARLKRGGWTFIEAGPGSCAGTGHEAVYKAVIGRLAGGPATDVVDLMGGTF